MPHPQQTNARTNQYARLAFESPEERETTLQQRSTNRHERLAVETTKEREFEIRVFQYKVQKTTAYAVTTPTVAIQSQDVMLTWVHWIHQHNQHVQKDFMALFHPKPNQCLGCSSDKHAPKLYSSANNVIPGSIATTSTDQAGCTPK